MSATTVGYRSTFTTGPDGVGMTDLGTLGGGYSLTINDAGQVAGTYYTYSHTAAGGWGAFITGPDGVGMTDLGTLGGTQSTVGAINDLGQVVGHSFTAAGDAHVFITGPNGVGMTDLSLLAELPAGYVLAHAIDINNSGQILVAVSAVPEPEAYALMLAGLMLIGILAPRRKPGAASVADFGRAWAIGAKKPQK
jgi:probable HAF family extracellular repeat protein